MLPMPVRLQSFLCPWFQCSPNSSSRAFCYFIFLDLTSLKSSNGWWLLFNSDPSKDAAFSARLSLSLYKVLSVIFFPFPSFVISQYAPSPPFVYWSEYKPNEKIPAPKPPVRVLNTGRRNGTGALEGSLRL